MSVILIACERSQRVTKAFRKLGYEAFSCDVQKATGRKSKWHIQDDVQNVMYDNCWKMIIAFPPCTHLASSGARWMKSKRKEGKLKQAHDFFMLFVRNKCMRIAIENPIGIMSYFYRKPDQIVQPWMFGDPYQKSTCLWLKNLPLLTPTDIVDRGETVTFSSGKTMPAWYNLPPGEERSELRSKTFSGIAKAMAQQWGPLSEIIVKKGGFIY